MFEKSESFPDGWFFIKNQQNGYVLSIEDGSHSAGSPVVLSSLRTKEADSQLWRTDDQQRLVNKKTGQVMDVAQGKKQVLYNTNKEEWKWKQRYHTVIVMQTLY
jgi:hypothetical protein